MTDTRSDKTAVVVVTYNRKELLAACLASLRRQSHPLDAIYIIDNASTDGTETLLREKGLLDPPWAHYVRMPENTGGAGGFHEGVKRARDDGFDWLWLMDDDLLAAEDALAALVRKRDALAADQGRSFLLNSLVLSRERPDGDTLAMPLQELGPGGRPKLGVHYQRLSQVAAKLHDGLYRWACPFNGTLIPACRLAQIGLPNPDFFIWGDERDFLWRAAKVLELYTVVDSVVYHPEFRGFAFDWKFYYFVRNGFVVNEHFDHTALRNLKLAAVSLARGLAHGPSGLALMLRAVKDGLTRNLGKRQDLCP